MHYWNQSAEPPESKASLMSASEKIFLKKYYPNGPPPLPRCTKKEEFIDLGKMSSAPELVLPDEARHLDIGVQDDFMRRLVLSVPILSHRHLLSVNPCGSASGMEVIICGH